MATVTIRLNKQEEEYFKTYAEFTGEKLSSLFKQALEEKIEDEYDLKAGLKALEEFEKDPQTISFEEVKAKYAL